MQGGGQHTPESLLARALGHVGDLALTQGDLGAGGLAGGPAGQGEESMEEATRSLASWARTEAERVIGAASAVRRVGAQMFHYF